MIDDGGHALVRRELEEVRLELIASRYADRLDFVGQPGFFEENCNFVAIRGWPIMKLDHRGWSFLS